MLPFRPQLAPIRFRSKKAIAMERTLPYPALDSNMHLPVSQHKPLEETVEETKTEIAVEQKQMPRPRIIATIVIGALAIGFYFIVNQNPSPASQSAASSQATVQIAGRTTPMMKTFTTPAADTTTLTGSTIQVYIIGAVQHPGVYTLATNARVYQLVQAAGGPLNNANLAVINMAARLSDGQEIYLPHIGETPVPAMSGTSTGSSQGSLVNINEASADELRQSLQVSSKTAQDIVNYRLQHGSFSSVDALLQAVSKTIYNKIKDKVTI